MNRLLVLPLSLLLLVAACRDATGPAPSAARLEISPASVSLGVGEIVQLEARILDQVGRPMGGSAASITWSSSDTSVVGIDATGVARGLRLGAATLTARSGALQGSAQAEVVGPRVQRQEDAAARSTIGSEGGSLSATAASGTRYTLSIPAGALQQEREITVTPLASIQRFPGGAEVAAGVHFAPEGLVLHRAATLEIELPAGRPAAGLLAFAYGGEGEDLHLTPSQADGQTLRLRVTHFSGGGAVAPPNPWTPPSPGSPEAQAKQALALLLAQAAPDLPAPEDLASILRTWYTDGVRPALAAAGSSAGAEYATYLAAVREHGSWDDVLLILGVVLEAEQAEARQLHVPMLRTAIEYANQRCEAEQSLLRAAQALWLQERAEFLELATPENVLDRATILQTLCLNAVFEHLMLLQEIEPGQSSQLSLLAGYGFGAGTTRFDLPFYVMVATTSALGTEFVTDQTNTQGQYQTTVFWPESTTWLRIRVTICLRSAYPGLHDVCREEVLERGGGEVGVRVTCRASSFFAQAYALFMDNRGNDLDSQLDRKEREILPPGDCRPGEAVDLALFSHSLAAEVELTYPIPPGATTTGSASASGIYSESITGSAEGAPGLSVVVSGNASTAASVTSYSGGGAASAVGQVLSRLSIGFEVHGAPVRYTLNADIGPGLCVTLSGLTREGTQVLINHCYLSEAGNLQLTGTLEPGDYSLQSIANTGSGACRGSRCAAPPPNPIPDTRSFSLTLTLEREQ